MEHGFHSLPEEIADKIKDMIFLDKTYCPGDRIPTESELSRMLNVGRNSVREAVKLLSANGILRVERGRGTFVMEQMEPETDMLGLSYIQNKVLVLEHWTQVRLALEPMNARLAAEYGSAEELSEIRRWERACTALLERGEPDEKADKRFHIAIAKASHNCVIERLMPMMETAISEIVHFNVIQNSKSPVVMIQKILGEHEMIASMIEQRNGEGAANLMRGHLQKVLLALLQNRK